MSNFDVKVQGPVSVVGERTTGGVASDEPQRDAASMAGVAHLAAHLPAKPIADSGVVPVVGPECAMPAVGLGVPVCGRQHALPVHRVEAARAVGNDAAMARHAAGDPAAFAELYDGLAPLVIAYLRRRTHDRNVVEDLVQETFLRLHLHRGRYRRDAPVLPWALTIAARLLANRVRGARRASAVFGEDDSACDGGTETTSPEQLAMVMELADQVEQEILRLPGSDREIFDLVRRQGLPLKIAAPRLSMTTSALKMRLFRVCGRLRRRINGDSDPGNGERK
jgi:RNA polymerase sigma-70 factor (ECF subfamily)